MYNSKCTKCGASGYQGLASFECSNIKCEFYVVPVNPFSSPPPAANPFASPQQFMPASGSVVVPSTSPMLRGMVPNSVVDAQINDAMIMLSSILNAGIATKAKVAGGAPRDWFFNNKAKDIDIFVEDFNKSLFLKTFSGAVQKLAMVAKNPSPPPNQSAYQDDIEVWDWKAAALDFQIIFPKNRKIKEHIEAFDFGLNMISMDHKGGFLYGQEFIKDYTNKTLTFYPARLSYSNFKHLYSRYQKMLTKFPGYRLEMGT
jgi:hypothetical protein